MKAKTWFITGGTPGGFGAAFAEAALQEGDQVVLTSRRPQELSEWAESTGGKLMVVPLDVTDHRQVLDAVSAARDNFGEIDILVNNAGRGWPGSVEGASEETVRRSFELNFFSVLNVTRAILPSMRTRRSGVIVNMSSVAGLVGIQGFGFYSAAKFALEGMTEVLRHEVEPMGIKVIAVEPGAFRTHAYAGYADQSIEEEVADYRPLLEDVRTALVAQDGNQPGDPKRGVRAVIDALRQAPVPRRLVLGGAGYDAAVSDMEAALTELRAQEAIARSADFPLSQ